MTVNTATGEVTESPTPYQLLPRLTDDEYAALKADIAENGIRVPIDVDEAGVIIDGHHRSWIAADLNVACPRRIVSGLSDEQKRTHAIAVNVYRRNLSRDARRAMVAKLRESGMSTRQIAAVADVDEKTVRNDLGVRPAESSARHTPPIAIVGQDGKNYQPETLEQRRSLAAELKGEGYSIAQIAELMKVAKSTAQSLLTPRRPLEPPLTKSPGDTPKKVEKIRELAAKGHTSDQIARELGYAREGSVKDLARDHDIDIPADRVMRGTRRLDHTRFVGETVAQLEALASGLDVLDFSKVDHTQADVWATSLKNSLHELNRLHNRIKEMTHD